jgi:glycosyltransferase involved in cell wall biosynthesis
VVAGARRKDLIAMSESPLPSVTMLVIAYRMAATIEAALRSVLAQTLPCDIIVSDDSSGDGSLDIAAHVLRNYDGPHRVRLRSTQRNVGLCAHLNELAAQAESHILIFASGDDVSYPQRAQRIAETFARNSGAQLIGSAVDDIDVKGNFIAKNVRGLPESVDQRWFLRRGKLMTTVGASMGIRRSLLTDFPPLAGVVEDNMLSLRAALAGDCLCIPEPLIGYRRHDNNLGDWVFDRSDNGYAGFERRHRRVLSMYRDIAADQERCVAARTDLPSARRELALELASMYRLEADMREALLDKPRRAWIPLLWQGLRHPGLRRKSAERALKLFVPRRAFGAMQKK